MHDTLRLSRDQVRAIDRLAIEEYGIPGIVLMENAGRGSADRILGVASEQRANGVRETQRVAVFVGPGNNGGDGCVVARHLWNAGIAVEIFATESADAASGDAAVQRRIVERMRIPLHDVATEAALALLRAQLAQFDVLVDALLGTGFHGEVRPKIARVIEAIDRARRERRARGGACSVVAIDVPSGLDCDTGRASNATVVADRTLTFVAQKIGFDAPGAGDFLGQVEVVSIGAPKELIARFFERGASE